MTKISQLGAAAGLSGSEVIPLVQDGETKKATADQLFAFVESEADRASLAADSAEADALSASENASLAEAWAEGTEPGGEGTKSAKEHAEDASAVAASVEGLFDSFEPRVEDIVQPSAAQGAIIASVDGKELLGFDRDGRQRISEGLLLHKVTVDPNTHLLHFLRADQDDRTFPLTLALNMRTGELALGKLDQASKIRNGIGTPASSSFGSQIDSGNLVFAFSYGQSLSIGGGQGYAEVTSASSNPVLHHPSSHRHLMLNTGLNGTEDEAITGISDFVSAREYWELPRGIGQTGGVAFMAQIEKTRRLSGLADHYLFHSHGRGGWSIAQLASGSVPFTNGAAAMSSITSLSLSYSLAPVFLGTRWNQGEQDRNLGTSQAAYSAALEQLQDDLDSQYQSILPSASPYRLFVDQLSAGATSGTPATPGDVAKAQMASARTDADIYLNGPTYMFPRIDSVHCDAKGYDLMAERAALVMHEVVILDNESWEPCWHTDIVREGTTITVTVNVPNGALVVDEDSISPIASYGFTYTGADITDVAVGSTVSGSCDITITLDADAAGTLAYAWDGPGKAAVNGVFPHAGAWGNIRDGGGAEIPSETHPGEIIANWLCCFSEAVA